MFSFPVQNFCVLISPKLALVCLFGQFSCWVPKPALSFKDTWLFIAPLSHLPTASRLQGCVWSYLRLQASQTRDCLLLFLQQSMRYVYDAWNYLYYLNLIIRQMYQSSISHSYPCDQDTCVLSAWNINQERTMYTQFAPTSFSGNNQQPPLRQKAFPED